MANARNHPLFATFWNMRNRCRNPNSNRAHIYGNLSVCDRWLEPRKGFWNFLADMGEKPEGCSLDRIDGSKGYSPENCRWATAEQQSRNRKGFGKIDCKYVEVGNPDTRFRARYTYPGTRKHISCGQYDTVEEAHLAAVAHRLENYWRI